MVRLRVIVAADRVSQALEPLRSIDAVTDLVHLGSVAQQPVGDVILCDVECDEVTDVVSDLRGRSPLRELPISRMGGGRGADRAER